MNELTNPPAENLLLIVDDDQAFRRRLERTMTSCGFNPLTTVSVAEAKTQIDKQKFTHAIVDLRLGDGSGLDVVEYLHERAPQAKIVVLTGYGAIATAVAAVKMGAIEYLSKPSSDAEDIRRALLGQNEEKPTPPENPMSADRVKWEHIQRVYEMCDRNVSETARRLNMHRRTLQRILAKRAPNDD